MHAVAAHQREEPGEECAARRAVTLRAQRREFGRLEQNESQSRQTGRDQRRLGENLTAPGDGNGREPAEEAGGQEARSFPGNTVQLENLLRRRSARRCLRQHGIGCEQTGEDTDVGQKKQPEAVTHDQTFGRRSAAAMSPRQIGPAMAEAIGILDGDEAVCHSHGAAPTSSSCRTARLARSRRATSSAGMIYSGTSRQANTTKVAYAPTSPTIISHQMCQISAKPMKVAKKAQTKPVGLLRGISIGS